MASKYFRQKTTTSSCAVAITGLECSQPASKLHQIAIVHDERSITYQQLEIQSSDIAKGLRAKGVREGDRVVVLTNRCLEMAVLFIGVLKVGACYVPMDVDSLAPERIWQTISRVQPALIVKTRCQLCSEINCFDFVDVLQAGENISNNALAEVQPDPESIAYIIFTSGTTSTPKGVMVPRRALLNYVQQGETDRPFNMQVTHEDTVVCVFSPGFDACTGVIFSTLHNGGTLLISSPETLQSSLFRCTILPCTPSILHQLIAEATYPKLRAIFIGGEAPSHELIRAWNRPQLAIYNCYGPSETTCASLISRLQPDRAIDLGSPMHNSTLLLMKDGSPASEGEIWLSGPGLALGYLDDPEKTASKFVQHQGKRFYCTGDYAQMSEGRLYFLGRHDRIIKNRGFLINLDTEVVPALMSQHNVMSAFALHHEGRLWGFVTPGSCKPEDIQSSMYNHFNKFLVPDMITALDELPLTSNGKVDHRKLLDLVVGKRALLRTYEGSNTKFDILAYAIQESLNLHGLGIQPTSSFLQLGGNSLSAIRVLSILHDHNLSLSLAALLAGGNMRTIAESLQSTTIFSHSGEVSNSDGVRSLESNTTRHTSDLQRQLLVSMTQEPTLYYILIKLEFLDDLTDAEERLRLAWEGIYRRHTILQCMFDTQNETYHPNPEFALDWKVITHDGSNPLLTCQEQINALWSLASSWSNMSNPLSAIRFIHSRNHSSQLLWLVHHARVDGFSAGSIIEELNARFTGENLPSFQSFDIASRKQKQLSACVSKEARAFWERIHLLSLEAEPLRLPHSMNIENDVDTFQVVMYADISPKDVERTCTRQSLQVSTLIYAAWAKVISTYTNTGTSCFGVVFSGRNLPVKGANKIVGPLINVCPFPVKIPASRAVRRWLQDVQSQNIQMTGFQWSRNREQGSDTGRFEFDSLVSIQYGIELLAGEQNDGAMKWKTTVYQKSQFTWTLLVEIDADRLVFRLLYQPMLASFRITEQALSQFHGNFLALWDAIKGLKQLARATFCWPPVPGIDTLISGSKHQEIESKMEHTSLGAAFETIAHKHPDLVALESPDHSVTYDQLNSAANILASCVAGYNKRRSPIAVLADGSINWIVGILAVGKAGFTYCSIDTKLPDEHICQILHRIDAEIAISPSGAQSLPSKLQNQIISLNVDEVLRSTTDLHQTHRTGRLDDAVYLTFTSGTTGTPKSIFMTNRGLLSYISYEPARLHAKPGVRIAQTFSVGFDACAAEIFGTLCYGATLVLKSPKDTLYALRRANAAMLTPSLLGNLEPEEFKNLETIVLGGEAVSQSLSNIWATGRRLYNGYGPCECTIGAVFQRLSFGQPVTLGSPIPGMRVYVTHQDLSLAPMGAIGEICLSGAQVADGYHSSDSIEQDKFCQDPWTPGKRMFRTGDYGRWNDEMQLEFLGRRDRQVKLNGYRINLEEIEILLGCCDPNITRACVLIKNNQLIGFISGCNLTVDKIMAISRSNMPYYQIPQSIQIIENFPLTTNQKVDYRALEQLSMQPRAATTGDGLPLQVVRDVTGMWRDVLKMPDHAISADDNFMSLGGHSMLQLQLVARFSEHFGFQIPLSLIVKNPRLEDQVREIQLRRVKSASTMPMPTQLSSFMAWTEAASTHFEGEKLLSFTDQEMLMLSSKFTRKEAFNLACNFRITGPLEVETLEASIEFVLQRHRILRTRFVTQPSGFIRRIDPLTAHRKLIRITGPSTPFYQELISTPFDVNKQQLIDFHLYSVDDKHHLLLIRAHHAIMDASGLQNFLNEISRLYAKIMNKTYLYRLPSEIESPDSLDYIAWQSSRNPSNEATVFWQNFLKSPPSPLFLIKAATSPTMPLDNTACCQKFRLPSMKERIGSCSVHEIMLTAFLISLGDVLQRSDLIIAIPFSHRREPGSQSLMGNFLDRMPVRLQLTENMTLRSILHERTRFESLCMKVSECLRDASQSVLPFSQIVAAARGNEQEMTERHDDVFLFCEVVFSYHHVESEASFGLEDCEVDFVGVVKPDSAIFPLLVEVWEQTDGSYEYEIRWISGVVNRKTIGALIHGHEKISRIW